MIYSIGMFQIFIQNQRRASATAEEAAGWLHLDAWVVQRSQRLKRVSGGCGSVSDLPLFYLFYEDAGDE